MTIISIRLLHKGSIETAILFGFFTLLIGVTTLLYFLGKYQMLTSSDLTKLEKALQTLQKTVGNRFFFTESAIIILNDFSLCYYDCRKLKRIYFSDERERGNLYQNAVIHFVKKMAVKKPFPFGAIVLNFSEQSGLTIQRFNCRKYL